MSWLRNGGLLWPRSLKSTFICVDSHPDSFEGASTDTDINLFFFTWWKLKIYIKRYIKKDFKTFKYSFIKLAYFLYIKELFKKYFVTTLLKWIWYLLITFEKWVQFRNKMHSDIQTKKCRHNALNQSFMCSSNIFRQNEINDSKWFRYWDTRFYWILCWNLKLCASYVFDANSPDMIHP